VEKSTDGGLNWVITLTYEDNNSPEPTLNDVIWTGAEYVAVSETGTQGIMPVVGTGATNNIEVSLDASDWRPSGVGVASSANLNGVASNGGQRSVAVGELGEVDICLPCAGSASTGYLLNMPTADKFRKSMELNYIGTVNTVNAVVGSMVARKAGDIVVVSSGLSWTAYMGYCSYVPTKFALRGFSDVLRSELSPHKVRVHHAAPPTMDTPGYRLENLTKPAECQAIEKGEPVYQADVCARAIVDSLRKGEYNIACGDFGINLLSRASTGIAPRNNVVLDILLAPILVLVSQIYLLMWDHEIGHAKYSSVRPYKQGLPSDASANSTSMEPADAKTASTTQRKRSSKIE